MNTHQLRNALSDFKSCADQAPEGCYDHAKELNAAIGEACRSIMSELRALGLKASPNDLAFDLEAAIYDYAKRSNPDATVFPTAEGFGSSLAGPARERVLAQATQYRDALRNLQH
jgi:hypothetical protein